MRSAKDVLSTRIAQQYLRAYRIIYRREKNRSDGIKRATSISTLFIVSVHTTTVEVLRIRRGLQTDTQKYFNDAYL